MKKALLVLAFFLPMVDGSDSSAAPFVYVSSPEAGVVKLIDQAANGVAGAIQLVATIQVGGQPTGLALNESGTMLYVANTTMHRVDFIDTKTRLVTASVPTVGAPFLLTYDQASGKLYIIISSMTFGDYPIVVIDTTRQTVIATIPSSVSIGALQVDRARGSSMRYTRQVR